MTQQVARPAGSTAELVGVADVGQLVAGARVDVGANEAAVFVKDGYPRGRLGPGCHTLTEDRPLAGQLLAPGSTRICFVTTTPVEGIEVGGSLGPLPTGTTSRRGQLRAYAEITVQVVDPESFVAAALPATSQDAQGWLNARLLQALQRTVTSLVASGEVNVRTLASSVPLVDHHLCSGATDLETAGVRVLEVTDVTVPDGKGEPATTEPSATAAEVPAGKTVLGSVPLEAFTDSSPAPQLADSAGSAGPARGGGAPGWSGGAQPTAPANYDLGAGAPMAPAGGGQPDMAGYGPSPGRAASGYGMSPPPVWQHAEQRSSNAGCVIGGVVLGLGAVLVGAFIALAYWSTKDGRGNEETTPKSIAAVAWDGASRYTCTSGKKRIQNVSASLSDGAAIDASGSCDLVLENVDIDSPIGVRATGSAKVTVDGGSIRGTSYSIEVGNRATVYLKGGAQLLGRFNKSGSGRVLRVKQR